MNSEVLCCVMSTFIIANRNLFSHLLADRSLRFWWRCFDIDVILDLVEVL